jgi:hypothetical protein
MSKQSAKNMKQFLLLVSGLFAFFIVFTNTSCQKDTDCKARVKCVDSIGRAVANANVLLYAQIKDPNDPKSQNTYTADVKAEGNTDGAGEVEFVFQLPAILDIRATGSVGTKTVVGNSIIKLEEGKTAEKTVTLK